MTSEAHRRAASKYYTKNKKAMSDKFKLRMAEDPEFRSRRRAYERAYRSKHAGRMAAYRKTYFSSGEFRRRNFSRTLVSKYGITREVYDAMVLSTLGKCFVCGRPDSGGKGGLSVDHCHSTGRVRGLLCQKCNCAIGHAMDSAELLEKLATYLRTSR